MDRSSTKLVKVGGFGKVKAVDIGGGSPIAVQTMYKDRLSFADLENETLIRRIEALGSMGCGLLRFAVPDTQSAEVLGCLAAAVSTPLAADIHFDYKLALRCMDFPVAKLRINPGNLGGRERTRAVLEKAGNKNIPIRIGVNAGSLPLDLRGEADTAQTLVLAAERELAVFGEFGFNEYVVSMKASVIADTIRANRIFSSRNDAPLHLGVTEAGPLAGGVVKNTAALLTLLKEGIGDTIRVSLSDTMENEVIAGREILKAASELNGQKGGGVNIVSCPRCGRYGFDTHDFTSRWLPRLYALDKDITVAVMGCEVNGPQEAKHADIGITGAGDKVLLFRKGKIIRTIDAQRADAAFEEELQKL
ncbi:MAG: (E)-4-hydroxy-3-methylbut-2-enyl-diphosphate synthase [Treponema sp.]|nr:(E)-4-hydroxy-3-methylbut-2-enyl-diphosphate synthase [Treponema sp.]